MRAAVLPWRAAAALRRRPARPISRRLASGGGEAQGQGGEGELPAALAATQRWVDEMVVGLALCPYTKPLRQRPHALRLQLTTAQDTPGLLAAVDAELQLLKPGIGEKHPAAPTPETTLLVVAPPDGSATHPLGEGFLGDFREFLHAAWAVEERIAAAELSDSVQLACFHPCAVYNTYAELAPTTQVSTTAYRRPSSLGCVSQRFSVAAGGHVLRPRAVLHPLPLPDLPLLAGERHRRRRGAVASGGQDPGDQPETAEGARAGACEGRVRFAAWLKMRGRGGREDKALH